MLDETYVTPDTSHQTLETRTAMAYWQNGKVHVYTGTQSTAQTVTGVARWVGVPPEDVVVVSEYTGGGFGSKITGAISLVIPVLLAKKANAPVMMRISREEEHYIGRGRPGVRGRMKVGFAKDGRITRARHVLGQRQRPVRAPGRLQQHRRHRVAGVSAEGDALPRHFGADEHAAARSAKSAGRHAVAHADGAGHRRKRRASSGSIRWRFAASTRRQERRCSAHRPVPSRCGSTSRARSSRRRSTRAPRCSSGRNARLQSGKRNGSKVRGVGVAVSTYSAGSIGFDGLFVIKPDGRLYVQSGIGNHGTGSVSDCHRVSADILGVPWDKVVITFGDTSKNLPWTCPSGGSQTIHAMTRAAHAAGMDAMKKLQEIAAKDLGGRPEDYQVAGERVFRKGGGAGMTPGEGGAARHRARRHLRWP